MRKQDNDSAIARLVEQCLANANEAWRLLYQRYYRGLWRAVRKQLGGRGRRDPALVDDIVQNVFVILWQNDAHRLRRWRPQHGALSTFLHVVAHQETINALRALKKVKQHQTLDQGQEEDPGAFAISQGGPQLPRELMQEEFRKTLSPRLREFLACARDESAETLSALYSETSIWKMKERLRAKWRKFLTRHGQPPK